MFATCEARTRDWGDLVTIHKHHAMAYVWSSKRNAQSGPVLRQPAWNVSAVKLPPPESCHATCVAISSCGNFALVGTRGGCVYKYNVESGIPRGEYPRALLAGREEFAASAGSVSRTTKALEKNTSIVPIDLDKVVAVSKPRVKTKTKHEDAVVGLAVDASNETLISVGKDSKLITWYFATQTPKKAAFLLPSPPTKLCHVRESDLAAIALANHSIIVFDCSALAIVRKFGSRADPPHSQAITDLGFGPDGRMLFSSVSLPRIPTDTHPRAVPGQDPAGVGRSHGILHRLALLFHCPHLSLPQRLGGVSCHLPRGQSGD